MQDPRDVVARALAADAHAVHTLVAVLTPALQREINAGLLARNLTAQAGRHDVLDLLRDLMTVLFDDGGALLRSWSPEIELTAWAGRLAATQTAAVLDRAVSLPEPRRPGPEHVEAWWQAALQHRADLLPLAPEHHAHALALLRPVMEHEQHALAAEVLAASQRGRAPDRAAPRVRTDRRGLMVAGGIAATIVVALGVDRLLNDPFEDLIPSFSVRARRGSSKAPPAFAMGERFQLILRPAEAIPFDARTPSGGPLLLGVSAYVRDEQRQTWVWRHAMARSPGGDLVLTGVVGKDLPVVPGVWDLLMLVGPREHLDETPSAVATAAEAPEPPLRRVRYRFEVYDSELLKTTTSTSS